MNSSLKIATIKLFTSPIVSKLWILFSLNIILLKGILPGWNTASGDFNNYYVSAKLVSEGVSIHQFYDNDWFHHKAQELGIKEGAKFSPFPPITAYVYLPLTFFEPLTAKRVWLMLNILIVLLLPFRIRKITDWSLNQAILFLSLFIIPISSCLNFGQLYLVIGFLLIELFGQQYSINRPVIMGSLLGILTSLKYLPIIFLSYIFKHKRKKIIFMFTLIGVVIPSSIVFLINPHAYDVFFQYFSSHLQGDLHGQGKYAIAFQSIDSMLNNLFVYDALKNPTPSLNSPILKPIIKYLLLGIVIGLILNILRKNSYKTTPVIASIGIVGVFVIIPATASYHFLLLFWPVLCLIKWLISLKSKQGFIIFSILIFITFTIQQYHILNFSEFPTVNLLLHYPRFWSLLCVFLFCYYFCIKSLNRHYG